VPGPKRYLLAADFHAAMGPLPYAVGPDRHLETEGFTDTWGRIHTPLLGAETMDLLALLAPALGNSG
jgi:hypothetical protein